MTQLIPKPRLLPLRILSGRGDDRVAQLALGEPPRQHGHDLAVPYAIEPGVRGRDAAREQTLHLPDQAGGEHSVHTLGDAALQHVSRQREVNVPCPHRPGLARVPLPPAERTPGEERDFDRARRPLPPPAREPSVEPRGPVRQAGRGQAPGPGPQPLPPTTTGWRPAARTSASHPAASRANRPAL